MCGIFGVLRKPGAARVSGRVATGCMDIVRHRGSGLGGGFAAVTAAPADAPWTISASVASGDHTDVAQALATAGFTLEGNDLYKIPGGAVPFWTAAGQAPPDAARAVDRVNHALASVDARVVAASRRVRVWKDVAHPIDVAEGHALQARDGDAWIAHTREPTNSPGRSPIWSHPFAVGDVAIVHNGDISSFGANRRFLERLGFQSFTGTDSEVMAFLLHYLLAERGLSPEEAARVLVDPTRGGGDADLAGAGLDGPFTLLATWADARETYLLAVVDRQKLRPLILGEDENAFYAASEESQIRAVSPDAHIWTPAPGSFFLASSARGILHEGRAHRRPPTRSPRRAEDEFVAPAHGRRFLGSTYHRGQAMVVEGPVGNCLANGLDGGAIVVHGNAADDVGDAMLSGRIVIHGDARDVLAQAMQGGVVLVRGSAGNRVGLQMRQYEDEQSAYRFAGDVTPGGLTPNLPALVVGGGVDDYFGEYMAGGVAMVLNLIEGPAGLTTKAAPQIPVGRYVGTGMVGGRLYIRGDVPDDAVGLGGADEDVRQYLDTLVAEGRLAPAERDRALAERDPTRLREILPEHAHRMLKLVESKYHSRPRVRSRRLGPRDRALVGRALDNFFEAFEVSAETREAVLDSTWTVIDGVGGGSEEKEEG